MIVLQVVFMPIKLSPAHVKKIERKQDIREKFR